MLNRSSKIYPRKYKVTPGTAYDTTMVFAAAVKALRQSMVNMLIGTGDPPPRMM